MTTETTNITTQKPLAVIASSSCTDGYELAKQFAEHGYDIIVAAANPSVVEKAEDLKEHGIDAVSFQLDLSTTEGVEQLYRRIIATGRPVEAMVINTGLSTDNASETDLALKVLKYMSDRGYGRILFAGGKGEDATSELMSEVITEEAKGTGVTVTSVKFGTKELYFLKEGYDKISDEKEMLH